MWYCLHGVSLPLMSCPEQQFDHTVSFQEFETCERFWASCELWLLVVVFFCYYYYFAVNLVWFGFVCLEQWEKCMSMVHCKLYFKYNWKLKNHCITCIMQLKRIFLNQSLIWQQRSSFFFQLKCFNKNMIFLCPPWIQKWARLCSWTSEGIRMLLCDSISQPLVKAAAPMS